MGKERFSQTFFVLQNIFDFKEIRPHLRLAGIVQP